MINNVSQINNGFDGLLVNIPDIFLILSNNICIFLQNHTGVQQNSRIFSEATISFFVFGVIQLSTLSSAFRQHNLLSDANSLKPKMLLMEQKLNLL